MANQAHTTRPSKFNKSKLMKRAWEIFKSTYRYPEIPFKSIGWLCFASCLKMAWAEFKRPVIVSSKPLPEQLASLQYAHKINQMSDNRYATNGGYAAAMRQIRTLESQIATEGRVAA